MAHQIEYKIIGESLQLVEVELDPGEGVRAEPGAMTYMEDGIQMDTGTGGGVLKGLKRMVTGESFFIISYTNNSNAVSRVAFAAPYPGRVVPLDLAKLGGTFMCQKDSFLCAATGIEIEVAFTKRLGAGLFGGEGFILQKLTGDGLAFAHAGGMIIEKDLKEGETLRVDTGCLVAFAPTVDYDIQFIGGFKNVLFGGEGLFLAKMTGPGKVYLQSLPLSRMADRIIAAARTGNKDQSRGASGVDVIGNIFGN